MALAIICIGSVSASNDFDDANLTVDDNSQEISKLNGGNDIDEVVSEDSPVDVEEEQILTSSDEDVLGADATLEIRNPKDSYTTSDSVSIYMGQYSFASDSSSVDVYLNGANVATTTYGEVHSSNGYSLSLSNAITGENTVYCQGSSMFGTYTSDSVTFTVNDGSGSEEITDDDSNITLKITDVYSKYDGQSSSAHFPYNDSFAFIAASGNNARYNIIVTLSIEGASASAKIKYGNNEQSVSGKTASIEFNADNAGENTVYVLDGNKKSNELTVKVVSGQNKIASLSIDPEWGVEGKNVTITPTAMSSGSSSADGYTSRPISGYVTFYSSSSFSDATKIATISTDGGSLTVPMVDIDAECDYIQLYYTFAGEYNNKGFIHSGSKYVYFLVLDSNPIALTANGETGSVEVDSERKVTLHVEPTYYMNDGASSLIDVYVGTDKVGTFTASSTTAVNDFELDLTAYGEGDYDVYVNYAGYNFEDENGNVYYHASNESNHIMVHVPSNAPAKTLKIDIAEVEYPNQVVAIVNASETGTYTITINGKTYPIEIKEEDNGVKAIALDKFAAKDSYEATIVADADSTLSNATTFKVNKGSLVIELAMDGEDKIIKPGDRVSFTITYSDSISDNLELWINDYSLGGEDGSSSTSITFDESDVGKNDVFIKFLGNENYTACVSNNVTIDVVKPVKTSVTLELSSNEIVPGKNITLIPKVVDENGDEVTVGVVRIYDNMYCNNDPIATINAGETVNYTDLNNYAGTAHYLYAKYMGFETESGVYSASDVSKGVSYTVIADNKLVLTANGESEITVYVGQSVDILAVVNGNGVITLSVNGKNNCTLTKGEKTSFVLDEIRDYEFAASYERGSDYYVSAESDKVIVHVIDKQDVELDVFVDDEQDENNYYEDEWGTSFDIEVSINPNVEGVIIFKEGDKELGRCDIDDVFELDSTELGLGEHTITAVFEGNDTYKGAQFDFTINIIKKTIWFTLEIDNVTYPDHAVGKFYGEDVDGKYTITINGTDYEVDFEWTDEDVPVSFDINQLLPGTYDVSAIAYEDMEHYEFGISEREGQNVLPTFTVNGEEVALDGTVLKVENGTSPVFSIDLPGAEGNLTVTVGDNNYTAELKDGKATVEITDLPAGNYTATVTYTGDEKHQTTSVKSNFTVEKQAPQADSAFDVNIPSGSTNPVFEINLPNATGNLTVTIGNNTYTKELVNGSARITVDGLAPGSYNATVSYSGDKNYASISKVAQFTVPTPKLSAKNVAVVYSAKGTYKVLVTVDGKAVVGEKVSIKFNGKTYHRTTDKKGYATLSLNTKVKVKSYAVTAEFKGVKVSNVVTIKHLIKAKNVKVKKSKKVSKIKVKTNKVNGKFLKGKKLKLKLKGKTLKAKINKKGVAKFKVKKKILKKLKAGKKYKYTVSYGKDSVTKKVKVKR